MFRHMNGGQFGQKGTIRGFEVIVRQKLEMGCAVRMRTFSLSNRQN